MTQQLIEGNGIESRHHPANCTTLLDQARMGNAHDDRLGDRRVLPDGSLHFCGIDVETAADDLVLDAADNLHIAIGTDHDLVAGQQVSARRELRRAIAQAHRVTQEQRRSTDPHLPPLARGQGAEVRIERNVLRTCKGATVGMEAALVAVVETDGRVTDWRWAVDRRRTFSGA